MTEGRKWATFYMDRERDDLLEMALYVDSELREMFEIKLTDRFGKEVVGWGRDWDLTMLNAEATLHYSDELELGF